MLNLKRFLTVFNTITIFILATIYINSNSLEKRYSQEYSNNNLVDEGTIKTNYTRKKVDITTDGNIGNIKIMESQGEFLIEDDVKILFNETILDVPKFVFYSIDYELEELVYYQANVEYINDLKENNYIYFAIYPKETLFLETNKSHIIYEDKISNIIYSIILDLSDIEMYKILGDVEYEFDNEIKDKLSQSHNFMSNVVNYETNLNIQETKTKSNTNNYDNYTNDKKFIIDYVDKYFMNHKIPGTQIITDDPIVKLVPKELMFEVGNHLYIGKEYAFFIKTTEDALNRNDFASHVMVIDINNVLPIIGVSTEGYTEVIPLFQFTYRSWSKEYRLSQWSNIDQTLDKVVFVHPSYKSNEYFIDNVNFKHTISNPLKLNIGDDNYDPYEDDGFYFIQSRYSSKGVGIKKKNGNFVLETISFAAGIVFDKFDYGMYLLNTLYGFIKGDYKYHYDILNDTNDKLINTKATVGKWQIEKYGNLIKSQTTTITPDANSPRIINVGGYVRSNYIVAKQHSTDNYDFHLRTSVSFRVVDDQTKSTIFGNEKGQLVKLSQSSNVYEYSDFIRNPDKNNYGLVEIEMISKKSTDKNVFLLNNYEPGLYNFNLNIKNSTSSYPVIIIHDLSKEQEYKISNKDSVRLERNNQYIVLVQIQGITNETNYTLSIQKPANTIQDNIDPNMYRYGNQYNNLESISTLKLKNYNVTLKSLRVGYISSSGNKYLTLSAKHRNANKAYLEYHFDRKLNRILYDLSLWSSAEGLTRNSEINLEILDQNNNWIVIKKFNPSVISKDKDNPDNYDTEFPFITNSFRFIINTNQVDNDNNRGRLIVGNIDVISYLY